MAKTRTEYYRRAAERSRRQALRRQHWRKNQEQIAIRHALYAWDREEAMALRVWLADNAWLLLGMDEEEWHG